MLSGNPMHMKEEKLRFLDLLLTVEGSSLAAVVKCNLDLLTDRIANLFHISPILYAKLNSQFNKL